MCQIFPTDLQLDDTKRMVSSWDKGGHGDGLAFEEELLGAVPRLARSVDEQSPDSDHAMSNNRVRRAQLLDCDHFGFHGGAKWSILFVYASVSAFSIPHNSTSIILSLRAMWSMTCIADSLHHRSPQLISQVFGRTMHTSVTLVYPNLKHVVFAMSTPIAGATCISDKRGRYCSTHEGEHLR